jgi:hypothetical protein
MTRIVLISILVLSAASGCGLYTLSSYFDYSKCLRECDEEKFKDDASKQQCRAKCLAQFDYSDSPLRHRSDVPVKPKSDLDKIIEKFPFPRQDGKVE